MKALPKALLPMIGGAMIGGLVVWSFSERRSPATEAALASKPASSTTASTQPGTDSQPLPSRSPHKKPRAGDDEAREKLDETLRNNVVVNLGKVEDIGKQTASMMTSRRELRSLKATAPEDRTPEQKARLLELERQQAAALGMLSEIASFQDNPDEYARFFGAMLQQAANLDTNQATAVSSYMHDRAAAMMSAGLNTANQPTDPTQAGEWETRRDAFNKATAEGVAGILPPGVATNAGFTPGFLEMMEQDFQDEAH